MAWDPATFQAPTAAAPASAWDPATFRAPASAPEAKFGAPAKAPVDPKTGKAYSKADIDQFLPTSTGVPAGLAKPAGFPVPPTSAQIDKSAPELKPQSTAMDLFQLPAKGAVQAGAGLARLTEANPFTEDPNPYTQSATPAAKNALSDIVEGSGKAATPFILPTLAAEGGPTALALGTLGGAGGAALGGGAAELTSGAPEDVRLAANMGGAMGAGLATQAPGLFKVKSPAKATLSLLPGMNVEERDLPFLEEALKHTKAAAKEVPPISRMGEVPPQDITTAGQTQINAQAASHKANVAYQAWLDRVHNAGIQPNPGPAILAAFDKAIPLSDQNYAPAEVAAERARLQAAFDHPMSVYDVDKLRSESGVASFYNKTPGAAYNSSMQGQDQAIQAARRSGLNSFLYNTLDPHNNGTGPAYIKSIQSMLMELMNGANKGWKRSVSEEPWSIGEEVGGALKAGVSAPARIVSGNPVDTAPIKGKTNAGIERIFKSVGDDPEPYPVPQGPYPSIGPQRQLAGPGGLNLPPAPDTSGSFRPPMMGVPWNVTTKALPPPAPGMPLTNIGPGVIHVDPSGVARTQGQMPGPPPNAPWSPDTKAFGGFTSPSRGIYPKITLEPEVRNIAPAPDTMEPR